MDGQSPPSGRPCEAVGFARQQVLWDFSTSVFHVFIFFPADLSNRLLLSVRHERPFRGTSGDSIIAFPHTPFPLQPSCAHLTVCRAVGRPSERERPAAGLRATVSKPASNAFRAVLMMPVVHIQEALRVWVKPDEGMRRKGRGGLSLCSLCPLLKAGAKAASWPGGQLPVRGRPAGRAPALLTAATAARQGKRASCQSPRPAPSPRCSPCTSPPAVCPTGPTAALPPPRAPLAVSGGCNPSACACKEKPPKHCAPRAAPLLRDLKQPLLALQTEHEHFCTF